MEEVLSVPEVARCLRVKATTVRRWLHGGLLGAEAIREGKRNRYCIKKSLVEWYINLNS